MERVLVWCGVVFLAAAVSLMCVIAVGSQMDARSSAQFAGLDSCDGRPCFFGIVPGVTLWNEASTVIRQLWAESAVENNSAATNSITIHYPDGSMILWLESDRRKQTVRRMLLVLQESDCCLSVADVLARYHHRCGNGDWRTEMAVRGSTQLRYMSLHTRRTARMPRANLYTNVYSLSLTADLALSCR